jgi:hypothetical protein
MSLYVGIVQIVQRQGLAVIFHVVWFSLQEPVVCGLVAFMTTALEGGEESASRPGLSLPPGKTQ